MPQYSLVYFNARGRAEVSRLLFAQAGVEYKDVRVTREEWPALKPETPLGHLPYLSVDGVVKIAQSWAIARYLAREFGLYGLTSLEGALIDMIIDTVSEFAELAVQAKYADETSKHYLQKKFDEQAPNYIDLLTKLLKENEGGFFVGSQVSVADFAVYHYVQQFKNLLPSEAAANLEKNKILQHHRELIGKLPRIAEWVAKRPVTEI